MDRKKRHTLLFHVFGVSWFSSIGVCMVLIFLGLLQNNGFIRIVEQNVFVVGIELFFSVLGVLYALYSVHRLYRKIVDGVP